MSAAVQAAVVDAVVAAAALWLLWSFGPESWRTRLARRRAAPPYDEALRADALDGRAQAKSCDSDCGCG